IGVVQGDDGFRARGVRAECGFDLARLDPVPAHLHLRVRAAQVLQDAVMAPPGEVAAAVQPVARPAGHEPLGGQRGPLDVAAGESGSGDVDLAGDAYGAALSVRVEYVDAQVGQGTADPAGCPAEVVFCEFEVGDVDGRLGDPVHVDQPGRAVAVAVGPAAHGRLVECFAAEDHQA